MATWDNVRLCLVPCEVCVSCQEGPPGSPSSPRSGPVGSGGSVDSCLAWKLQRDSSWGWWEFRWCLGCHNRIPQTSSTADIVSHSSALEAGSPRPRCQQGGCLVRPPSHYVLTWPFLCVYIPRVSSSSYEDTSHIGSGLHPYDLI